MTHGDMDDNVHLQNSIYLISKLEDEGKVFPVYALSRMEGMDGAVQRQFIQEMKLIISG